MIVYTLGKVCIELIGCLPFTVDLNSIITASWIERQNFLTEWKKYLMGESFFPHAVLMASKYSYERSYYDKVCKRKLAPSHLSKLTVLDELVSNFTKGFGYSEAFRTKMKSSGMTDTKLFSEKSFTAEHSHKPQLAEEKRIDLQMIKLGNARDKYGHFDNVDDISVDKYALTFIKDCRVNGTTSSENNQLKNGTLSYNTFPIFDVYGNRIHVDDMPYIENLLAGVTQW
tara:strand:+ start:316 stop:999 length:684 start_codon:yes stop_codon:yes gene_type:complete